MVGARTVGLMAILVATMGLAGCARPTDQGSAPPGPIEFDLIADGQDSGIEERRTEVVRNRTAWEALWSEHKDGGAEHVPAVDFDEKIVAAAFMGESPDGCHGAEITSVTGQEDGNVLVEGEWFRVDAEACTQQVTYPFHVVKFDRYDTSVEFAMEETTRQPSNVNDSGSSDEEVPFVTLDQGQHSGIEQQRTIAVHNTSAWRQLWNEHANASQAQRPSVNFEEASVAAIFKGQSPDGCHGAQIEEVVRESGRKGVVVRGSFVERTDAYCTQQITYPFHIVQVNATDRPVRFEVSEASRPDEGPGDQGSFTCRTEGSDQAGGTLSAKVAFENVTEGQHSGVEQTCLTVAKNETAWRDLWSAHQARNEDPQPRPEVDFSEKMVVAVFKGQSPDTCHDATIEELRASNGTLVAHVVFASDPDGPCGEAIVYPFHMVSVDRYDKVAFEGEERTT